MIDGKLSKRESEVLAYLALGLSNREIAASLGISTSTVNKHAHQIFAKLNVRNGVQAASKAHELDAGALSSKRG
jgi:LuxR family transcriptional regulator, maltose regulon positive regulatory protein